MPDYVTLAALAEELGLDRSNTRKYVLKHGFSPFMVRTTETRGQGTLALSAADAEAVRELRQTAGYTGRGEVVAPGRGYVYIVLPIPEYDAFRVKLGFTNDLKGRLDAYKTSSPNALMVKAWPAERTWEAAAIASMTRTGCTPVVNEVYQCDDVEALMARGDAFFAIMPVARNGNGG